VENVVSAIRNRILFITNSRVASVTASESHLTVTKGRVGGTVTILAGGGSPLSEIHGEQNLLFAMNNTALFTIYGKKNIIFTLFGERIGSLHDFGRIYRLFSRRFSGKYVKLRVVRSRVRAPRNDFTGSWGYLRLKREWDFGTCLIINLYLHRIRIYIQFNLASSKTT
jgi:hypothetical protein